MRLRIDRRYALLTVLYLAVIYGLSSIPDLSRAQHPLMLLIMNLGHAPLFGGLAFCVLMSLSGTLEAGWGRYGLAFVSSGACGVLDEWHQSFVPGRYSSIGDFVLDLAGIGGMLLILRIRAVRNREWRNPDPRRHSEALRT